MKMRKSALSLLAACLVAAPSAFCQIDPAGFPYAAEFEIIAGQSGAVRMALTSEWLKHGGAEQHRIRLINRAGAEVPFAIVLQSGEETEAPAHPLTIASYDAVDGVETILLENPQPEKGLSAIRFRTPSRDFRRLAEVWTSNDRSDWQLQSNGVIFDASSRIDFKVLKLTLPDVSAKWLRIQLRDSGDHPAESASVSIRTHSNILVMLPRNAVMNIEGIDAIEREEPKVLAMFDSSRIPVNASPVDHDGRSIAPVEDINLPLNRLSFSVNQTVFSRRFSLEETQSGSAESFRQVLAGRIVGSLDADQSELSLAASIPYFSSGRIVIQNQSNPPLPLESVLFEWFRRELVFVADAGAEYTLLAGNADLPKVRYDIADVLDLRPSQLTKLPLLSTPALAPNAAFIAGPSSFVAWLTDHLILILVLLLAAGIGIWIFLLLRNSSSLSGHDSGVH